MSKKWIDVQDQLPNEDEVVAVCVLALEYYSNRPLGHYIQKSASFLRTKGWTCSENCEVHYWRPLEPLPPFPNWYKERNKNG